ncbi:MAG: dodecin domain-containing protein [Nitrosopumilus sp.]|nr:dodecin domain-containing protein [Nitrosopumilus sp.]
MHSIHRIEVRDMTTKVDSVSGKITSYRTYVKILFEVDLRQISIQIYLQIFLLDINDE